MDFFYFYIIDLPAFIKVFDVLIYADDITEILDTIPEENHDIILNSEYIALIYMYGSECVKSYKRSKTLKLAFAMSATIYNALFETKHMPSILGYMLPCLTIGW